MKFSFETRTYETLRFVGGNCTAAAGAPIGQQRHQVVNFRGGQWLEFGRPTIALRKSWHVEVGAAGDDDASQRLVADQGEEGGVVDLAAMLAAFAVGAVA